MITDTAGATSIANCSCEPGNGMVNDSCVSCDPGSYSVQSGKHRRCEQCALGKYTSESGSTTCNDCAKGEMTTTVGSTACTTKPPLKTCDKTCEDQTGKCGKCYENMTSCAHCGSTMSTECDSGNCTSTDKQTKCNGCIKCSAACDWPLRIRQCRESMNSDKCRAAKKKYTEPYHLCEDNPTWFSCILIDLKNRCENECTHTKAEKKISVPANVDAEIELDGDYSAYSLKIPMYTLKTEELVGVAVQDIPETTQRNLQAWGINPISPTLTLKCSPSGLHFEGDGVHLAFPISAGIQNPENLKVFYLPDHGGLPQEQTSVYNATSKTLTGTVKHFSSFVVARRSPLPAKAPPPTKKESTGNMRLIAFAGFVGVLLMAFFFAFMCLIPARPPEFDRMQGSEVSYYILPEDYVSKYA